MKRTVSIKLGIAIAVISLIALIIGYAVLQFQANKTKEETYLATIAELQSETLTKFNSKKAVGISNAVSIANDGRIKKALRTDDRKWAITTLSFISAKMKKSTPFKNIKVHVHTKDNRSFVRSWKIDKFGDDLSSFRDSVVKVNSTQTAVNTFEVGKAGLSLRSVACVTDDNGEHLGSLEFMQGLNSVAKAFDKLGNGFLLLMDENLKKADVEQSKMFKNYIISQNFINKTFLSDAKSINMAELFDKKQFTTDKYFYTFIDIKDFNDKKLGIALVGKPIEKVYSAIDNAQAIIYLALGLIVALIVFIIIFIIVSIKKVVSIPLQDLENAILGLIQSNDTSSRVKIVSDDEIGHVAKSFNDYLDHIEKGLKEDQKLIDEAKVIIDRVSHGWYSQTIQSNTQNQSLNEFKNGVNKMIEATKQHFANMNIVLEQYAKYDYRNRLTLDGIEKGGVFEILVNDINKLRDSITEMLVDNKTNGLTLQNSSQELLQNVSTLSTSSNEAAASLEETAAALEEVTSTIKSNNQNVSQMSSYANTVTDAASKGKELAERTVSSIDEINTEVTAINEAITVIDQIAFQTNILSLNAAVEAATAGEAGKGFAVVAQEVRNLASRSAEAAKEIKEIVELATQKATSGKNIAEQMIQGYGHLNSNIDSTIQLIKEVESASKEQQTGIVQINDAVNSLDQQTQKNAAVATQANDIAHSTQRIANDIVNNADEKEFEGKHNIQAKKNNTITENKVAPTPVKSSPIEKKPASSNAKLAPISSSDTNDTEWESF